VRLTRLLAEIGVTYDFGQLRHSPSASDRP
jgi:hypothetical protein